MSAPRIGLTTYREPVAHHGTPETSAYLPVTYLRSVEAAGGIPVLLPSLAPEFAAAALAGLDGVILTGGHDVDPAAYGETPHPKTEAPSRPERDAWEFAVWLAALDADLPALGICRGIQTLNVALGGTLIQHVPDVVGSERYSAPDGYADNEAILEPGTPLVAALGASPEAGARVPVKTSHHQAVGRLADGLTVEARSVDDLVYAVSVDGRRWARAVQWHPEEAPDSPSDRALFAAFVEAAQATATP